MKNEPSTVFQLKIENQSDCIHPHECLLRYWLFVVIVGTIYRSKKESSPKILKSEMLSFTPHGLYAVYGMASITVRTFKKVPIRKLLTSFELFREAITQCSMVKRAFGRQWIRHPNQTLLSEILSFDSFIILKFELND